MPAATNDVVSSPRYAGIYPRNGNVTSGKIFAPNYISVHPVKRRLCTAVLSNPEQNTDIILVFLYEQNISFITVIHS